jgi:hypothetical protein
LLRLAVALLRLIGAIVLLVGRILLAVMIWMWIFDLIDRLINGPRPTYQDVLAQQAMLRSTPPYDTPYPPPYYGQPPPYGPSYHYW